MLNSDTEIIYGDPTITDICNGKQCDVSFFIKYAIDSGLLSKHSITVKNEKDVLFLGEYKDGELRDIIIDFDKYYNDNFKE